MSLGKTILRSDGFQNVASAVLERWLRFTWNTNSEVAESDDAYAHLADHWPAIYALWHGQQLMSPYAAPRGLPFKSLVSRSADAEINARVIERTGHGVIRGSGGRNPRAAGRKGAVSATKAICETLRQGSGVVMIADISKGEPRKAGEGIVRIARISGRPIIPVAIATSRYHVVEKSWDRTTINLPFGKRCLKLGEPIYVTSREDEPAMRLKVTEELNRVTREAYQAVEGGS
ncbi:MAG: hypothetical protein CML29_07620 [Rhizobiales bacterium]|nr:hypothetical protein [Hyphomicrobiales bacterium]MBA70944.1 hypothetical protein [Hyphomicrobiales bacterium]